MSEAKRFNKVAVLIGGPSTERDISLRSGMAVARGLREAGYDVTEVDIKGHELNVPEDIEAVFIALHGEFGEDGQVQELLDQRGIPYTGSGPAASRNAFDKRLSKKIFVENGIPTPEYEILCKGDKRSIQLPVVTKPACQGSTIGVHRVMKESEWANAQSDTFSYGEEMIVESYINGRELTVGIIETEALPVIEIVTPDSFFNYNAKYTNGVSRHVVPALIDDESYRSCQNLSLRTFEALGCRGFARVDCRITEANDIYILELNSIPGFTEISLLPEAAAKSGIDFSTLCDRIMNMAEVG